MNHDSGFIIGIAHVFFAKILIERTSKNYIEQHPSTQNNPLVVLCNENRSTEKETVCVFQTKLKYARLFILLLFLLGPRYIQPSTYTNVATYPLGKYKQCHRQHSEQCTCTGGNDTLAYVHRQESLTGIRKPQILKHNLHKNQAILKVAIYCRYVVSLKMTQQ